MSYPSSLDSFPTKTDNVDTVEAAHINALQDAIVAIETELGTNPSVPLLAGYFADGRLTLETGVPVSSSDQSAKATLYYTPYIGNRIALYDGSSIWSKIEFSELSLNISGYTADKNYDIWVYNNSGTATLDSTIWTNDTTRATALAYQDGVLVKSGATTRRYVGTIRINSTGGQCEDTIIWRGVYNEYNKVFRELYVNEATSHTYNGAARKWNNSDTNNLIKFVLGNTGIIIPMSNANVGAGGDGSYGDSYIYIDGAQIQPYTRNRNTYVCNASIIRTIQQAAGHHYIQLWEHGNHASSIFTFMTLSALLSM